MQLYSNNAIRFGAWSQTTIARREQDVKNNRLQEIQREIQQLTPHDVRIIVQENERKLGEMLQHYISISTCNAYAPAIEVIEANYALIVQHGKREVVQALYDAIGAADTRLYTATNGFAQLIEAKLKA